MGPNTNKMLSVILLLLLLAHYLPLAAGIAYAAAEALNTPPLRPRQLSYPIAIIGDYLRSSDSEGDIYTLLLNNGFSSSDVVEYDSVSAFMNDLSNGQLYSLVILNRWSTSSGPGSADEVLEFVKALDLRDIPLLVLDAGYTSYTGGDVFYTYKDDLAAQGYPAPSDQVQKYPSPSNVIMDPVDAGHPVFSGVSDPYYLVDTSYTYADYAAWSLFTVTVTRLAWLNDTENDYQLYGIAEWVASGGESWIFMAAGSGGWVRYTEAGSDSQYSSDQATVFVNTVNYLIGTGNPHQPPKGTVYGYVFDAVTGNPVANATVSAGATTNTTNATGYYELHLEPGTYTVTVSSEPVYLASSFTVTIAGGDTHEVNVTLDRKPVVHGYVFDAETGEPLANARIYTNVSGYENYTDSSGYYMLRLDPGSYEVTVEHEPSHKPTDFTVNVAANNVYEHNVTLQLKPKADVFIALIGDEDDGDMYLFLRENYSVIPYADIPSFMSEKDRYEWDVIILNQISSATETDLLDLLGYANAMNIGILILDTWTSYASAGYKFYTYRDTLSSNGYPAPSSRTYDYKDSGVTDIQVNVINTSHPVFAGITSPYAVVEPSASEVDYAYYGGFTKPVTILANLTDAGSNLGISVAEWKAPGNESWIFISYASNIWHHYNTSTSYGYFSEEARKALIQAIDYVNTTHVPPPKVKIYGYVYDESMSPVSGAKVWIEGVGLANYTDSSGYYELNDVFGEANYTMKAAKIGYYIEARTVSVGDTDIQVDFILHTKPPSIVVVGDIETSTGKLDINLTIGQWWTVQEADNWKELIDIVTLEGQVMLVIFNAWGTPSPSDENVTYVLSLLDSNNIPVIFLQGGKSYPNGYAGIYQLYMARNTLWSHGYPAPNSSTYKFPDGQYLYIKMLDPSHDIFKNIAPDNDDQFLIMRQATSDADYYGFTWPAENLSSMTELGLLNDTYNGKSYVGVAIWSAPGGEKWIFLGHGGSTSYAKYSEPGSYNQYSYKMISLLNNSIHVALGLTPPTLTGKLEGTVTDQDSNPVAGATVEIVELGLINYTDSAGHYVINDVPSGTYTLRITKKGYYPYEATISIGTGTNTHDATLTAASNIVAVIGDKDADIATYLWENQSIYTIHYDNWDSFKTDLCSGNYSFTIVVIDTWGSGLTSDEIVEALMILDAYDLPVVFLDTWTGYTQTGVNALYQYHDAVRAAGYPAPIYRDYEYTDYLYITINDSAHPLFNGISPDFDSAFYVEADYTSYTDGAYWYFDPADGVTVLGYLGDTDDYGLMNATVAEWTAPGGEKWIFLGAASTLYMKYSVAGTDGRYSAKAWLLLVNAIRYANSTHGATPSTVVYQLTVMDLILNTPIENAVVTVNETGDTYYTAADGTATITLPISCGNYTLIISKSGHTPRIISLYGFINKSLTVYLPQYGNGTITGYVYDADTGDPISGATVYIPGVNSTTTGPDGSFSLKVPSGNYTVYAIAPLYLEGSVPGVTVPANDTVSITIYLEKQPPTVLVVGDEYSDISALLQSLGYNVEVVNNWSIMMDKLPIGNYIAVIINSWGPEPPTAENVTAVLSTLDALDIPVLFLDGHEYTGEHFGVNMLYTYRDNVTALGYPAPETRGATFSDYGYVYILMLHPDHPLFNGITPDTDNMFLLGNGTGYYEDDDYAYYTFPDMANLMILGNIYDTGWYSRNATAIAVWISPGGARWIYLGASASGYWMRYTEPGRDDQYSDKAAQLLANALAYALTYNTSPSILINVTVYDKLDRIPIDGVNVTIAETGASTLTGPDGRATIISSIVGKITINISKPGYNNISITLYLLDHISSYSIYVELKPYGNGTITGYVIDADTGAPISGANVSIPGVAWTLSGGDGSYVLELPADVYSMIRAVKINYYDAEKYIYITLHPGDVVVVNITMERAPPAVMLVSTDYNSGYIDYKEYADDMKAFLESLGYYVVWYPSLGAAADAINAGLDTRVVVLGKLYDPTASELLGFVQLLDEKNISLIILDTYGSYSYNAGYYFYSYRTTLRSYGYIAPATREYYYPSPEYVTLRIEKDLYGFTYDIGFTEYRGATSDSSYFDYAVYTFEPTDLIDVVVTLHDTYNYVNGVAVAVWYPEGGERWIFISYGLSHWVKYMEMGDEGQFTDEAKLVFAKAINYATMRGIKIEIENFTVTVPRENGVVMPGDTIRISGYAYYWVGNTRHPLANTTLTVYLLSTPYEIGNVTTGPDGGFDKEINIPEDTPPGEHAIGVGGDEYTIYVLTPEPGEGIYAFLPAPEPPITPLILLAAILLIVLFKKRR